MRLFCWKYRCGVAILAFGLAACQVKRPDYVLPDAKMEDVLYDFHIAKALGDDVPYNENYIKVLYVDYVYQKHGISKSDFDSSLVWYARHPDVISKIYERVTVRLKANRNDVKHLLALRDNKPTGTEAGDSVNVWLWNNLYLLSDVPLCNKLTFSLNADTNFYKKDTLRWFVRYRYKDICADSIYQPVMAMRLKLDNDSVIMQWQKMNPQSLKWGMDSLTMTADTVGKIKEISGFIYYPKQEIRSSLLIDSISLMRYHAH